jgi:hypothetical protein
MWQIFVEDNEIDVPGDLSAQFNFSIDDIRQYGYRNSTWSKTIVLYGTARNKKIFGHVFDVGSANFVNDANPNINYDYNAAKSAKCIVLEDGLLIVKGVIRILNVIIDGDSYEVEVAITGELGGLIAAVADKKLEDLDFSAYDQEFSLTNIEASWAATPGSGVYYPLIDCGYSQDKISFQIQTFRPSFYVKEYLDKIFEAAGYTYESNFIQVDTTFKNLFIPYNGETSAIKVSEILHMNGQSIVSLSSGTNLYTFSSISGTTYIDVTANNKFTWKREVASPLFRFTGGWNRTSTAYADFLYIEIHINGGMVYQHQIAMGALASGTIDFSTLLTIDYNDYIEIKTNWTPSGAYTLNLTTPTFYMEGQPDILISAIQGDDLEMNNYIPKGIFQKDFLSSIIKMFNLYIDEDETKSKHLVIEPYVEYYDTTSASFLNWDNKIDRSRKIHLKPLGEITARSYEFKYKDDVDYYNDAYKKKFNETYGTRLYDTGLEALNGKETIEVIFSPTPLVQYDGTDRIISVILKKDTAGVETKMLSNIRILLRSVDNIACSQWDITDVDGTSLETYEDYPYSGHLDDPDAPGMDINFGAPREFFFTIVTGYLSANLFNVFYSFYISEISDKDSKLMTAYFNLNALDIHNLDFSKLIFIMGQLWRLNKIEDYSTGQKETTKCELLKVIDIV